MPLVSTIAQNLMIELLPLCYTCHKRNTSMTFAMLTVRLDEETQRQLADMLAHEKQTRVS